MADLAAAIKQAEEALQIRRMDGSADDATRWTNLVRCEDALADLVDAARGAAPAPQPTYTDPATGDQYAHGRCVGSPVALRAQRPLTAEESAAYGTVVTEAFTPAPLPPAVAEAAERFRVVNARDRDASCDDPACIVCLRRDAGDALLAALEARKDGEG